MYDHGRFVSPIAARTRQCQSVQGQYPNPYHSPSTVQESPVNTMTARFARRNGRHIHPKRMNRINPE